MGSLDNPEERPDIDTRAIRQAASEVYLHGILKEL